MDKVTYEPLYLENLDINFLTESNRLRIENTTHCPSLEIVLKQHEFHFKALGHLSKKLGEDSQQIKELKKCIERYAALGYLVFDDSRIKHESRVGYFNCIDTSCEFINGEYISKWPFVTPGNEAIVRKVLDKIDAYNVFRNGNEDVKILFSDDKPNVIIPLENSVNHEIATAKLLDALQTLTCFGYPVLKTNLNGDFKQTIPSDISLWDDPNSVMVVMNIITFEQNSLSKAEYVSQIKNIFIPRVKGVGNSFANAGPRMCIEVLRDDLSEDLKEELQEIDKYYAEDSQPHHFPN